MNIDSSTKLLGIIGYPIKHSLSPTLHTLLAKKYDINFVYLAFEVLPENFKFIKDAIVSLNICGLNITIPYKEKIISYLDEIDKEARYIGAVNTVVNKNNKLVGYNTDIYGIIKSLEDVDVENEEAIVIGCGGVSKAIICACEELGIKKVYVYDIDKNKMRMVKEKFDNFVVLVKQNDIDSIISDVKIVVNATPLGMKEGDKPPLNLQKIKKEHIVYDVVYNRETELIKFAKSIGCKKVIDGVEMFVYQAEQSFFLWTGVKPDTKFMFKIVNKLLSKK
jgi:shikimate dehydrogenase